jgi:hypothetical protein
MSDSESNSIEQQYKAFHAGKQPLVDEILNFLDDGLDLEDEK